MRINYVDKTQILLIYMQWNVLQLERRITNQILGVKGLTLPTLI